MSGKSHRSGKRKSKHSFQARIAQQPTPPAIQPVSHHIGATVSTRSKLAGADYHYVVTELRTIGIMAGIMLLIIALLTLVI
ncbi:hypothetical protein ACFLUQ_02090 [Chloroflexota bacterium]